MAITSALDMTVLRDYDGRMTFESDLNRYLSDYEAAERADEIERDMRSESSDYAVNGEDATCIPANFVADADVPGARVLGPGHVRYVPDQYGDPWGRFEGGYTLIPY